MDKIDLPGKKKVGHLTLLRESRSITLQEFKALSFEERLDIVRRISGRKKYDLLIEANDAEQIVRRLPAQEVFFLVKEIGMEDATDLLQMASTAQVTTFLDLDCWDRDAFDAAKGLAWLTLLLETDGDNILATLREMDFGLLCLWLRPFLSVSSPIGDEDEEELKERLATDRLYDIDYRDSDVAKLLEGLFNLLKKEDRDFYLRIMEGLCWELDSELEEGVYRFRTSRLADRGFPDPIEALSVFSFLDPDDYDPGQYRRFAVESGEEGAAAPDFVLAHVPPGDFLTRVLAGRLDDDRLWELTFLLNKVMVADRVDLGSVDQVKEGAGEVYRYLGIALEHLSEGDINRAGELFEGAYLEHLFRLGFSLTLQLQRRARKVQASAISPYLDGPFRALVDALRERKPRLFEGVDDEARGGSRSFTSSDDLRSADQWLSRVEAQQRLFEGSLPFELVGPDRVNLEGCVPDVAEDLALSDLFLTALANRVLSRPFTPEAIFCEELPALHGLVSRGGKVDPNLRRETRDWLESLEQGGGAFADYCLDLWEEEFCALKPEDIDPRYVGGLIVRLK